MNKLFISLLILFALNSCGDFQSATEIKKEKRAIPLILSGDDIFNSRKIVAFLSNEMKYLHEANTSFLKGLDAYKNKQDLDSAEYYLRESLLKEPSGKAYFELGNVYLDKGKYQRSLDSYNMAEQLNFEPFSKILYNKCCVYSKMEKLDMAGKYLEFALQAGYNNLDHVGKDEDLVQLRNSYYYDQAMKRGMRGMSNPDKLFWLQFKKLFPKLQPPHKLSVVLDEDEFANLNYISYDFEKYISEMRDEKFSREVSKGFYHYAQTDETENYVALIYVVKDEFLGDSAPLTYRLATFTHDGKLIDKKDIGGRDDLSDPVLEATIYPEGLIHAEKIELIYAKDPDKHGYFENEVIDSKVVGKTQFKIGENGKISEITDVLSSK